MDDLLFEEIDMMFSQSINNEKIKQVEENTEQVVVPEIEIKNIEETFIETAINLLNNNELNDIIVYLNENKSLLGKLNGYNNKYKTEANAIILMFFHKVLDFLNIDFEIIVGEKESSTRKKLTKIFLSEVLNFSVFNKFNFCDQKSSYTCRAGAFNLMLKFKNVEISNSLRLKHTMPQINFMIPISVDNNLNDYGGNYCRIIRPVVTKDELYSSYNFSHSQGDCYSLDSDLCYGGSDTEINKKIHEFFNFFNESSIYIKSKFESFISIFATIDSYIRWESLEGTPYKYIKNIVKSNNEFYNDLDEKAINLECFASIIEKLNTNSLFNKDVIKKTLSISVESDLLNNNIINAEIINEEFYYDIISNNYITDKDNLGIVRYIKRTSSSNNVNLTNKYLYTDLTNKDIFITLEDNKLEQIKEKRIPSSLKTIIENKIKYYFNKKIYDKYIKKIEKC